METARDTAAAAEDDLEVSARLGDANVAIAAAQHRSTPSRRPPTPVPGQLPQREQSSTRLICDRAAKTLSASSSGDGQPAAGPTERVNTESAAWLALDKAAADAKASQDAAVAALTEHSAEVR